MGGLGGPKSPAARVWSQEGVPETQEGGDAGVSPAQLLTLEGPGRGHSSILKALPRVLPRSQGPE